MKRMVPVIAMLIAVLIGLSVHTLARPVSVASNMDPQLVAGGTGKYLWRYVRNEFTSPFGAVSANDAAVEPNEMTWSNTSGQYINLDEREATVSLAFYAYGDGTGDGDPNAGTVDVNVYLVEPYGSWEHVASFTVSIGELELTDDPVYGTPINAGSLDPNESYKWADGPFTNNLNDADAWPTAGNFSGSTNGIGRFNIDTLGAQGLIVRYDNMASMTRIYGVVKGR